MNSTTADKTRESRFSIRRHFLTVLILFIIMFYLLDTATNDEILDISSLLDMREQDYDYFMANMESVHYTASGQTEYRFLASRVTHFPNPEYSLMDEPHFMLYRDDATAWSINSDSGRVDIDTERNQERLTLSENVIINGVTADGSPVAIYTDSLTLYPEEKNMYSESDVLFESEGFSSSSKGFTADMNTNIIRQQASGRLQYDN